LRRDMAEAKANVVGTMREMKAAAMDFAAVLGVSVGAGAFAKLTLDTIKANAALHDLSLSTGSSVENLSRLQAVAKIGGHEFEGFVDQIGRMVKGLKSSNEDG